MKIVLKFEDRKMAFLSFSGKHHDIGLFELGGRQTTTGNGMDSITLR